MKILNVILIFLLLSISVVAQSVCVNQVESTDGTDYMGIRNDVYNTTVMDENERWVKFDFFTPRLNFTRVITSAFYGGNTTENSEPLWYMHNNLCNESLVLYNDTNIIPTSNYSYRWANKALGSWEVNWTLDDYNTKLITFTCNRTFTKNVDDLTNVSGTINSGLATSNYLMGNTPATFGDDKTFKFTSDEFGTSINVSNWAVGWTLSTCTKYSTGMVSCNNTKNTIYGAFALIALFVIIGGSLLLISMFTGNGNVDTATVLTAIIGFLGIAVMVSVGYYIITIVASSVCSGAII